MVWDEVGANGARPWPRVWIPGPNATTSRAGVCPPSPI